MTALERMAAAAFQRSLDLMREQFPHSGGPADKTWETLDPRYRARWISAQFDALMAIREPSEATEKAGDALTTDDGHHTFYGEPGAVFSAMVDHILNRGD